MNKLIVLKNFLSGKVKSNPEVIELISKTLEKSIRQFLLVFIESAPDKRTTLYKKLNKFSKARKADLKEFKLPQGSGLIGWIVARAKKEDVIISPESINLLAALVGNDLWQLDLEIQKLFIIKTEVGGLQ